jgi:5-methylcytosine-specific restriction endonuclease McrA
MIRDGKIEAAKVGAAYLVVRASVEKFERLPGMGRPRLDDQLNNLVDDLDATIFPRRPRVVPPERWYVLGRDKETCVYCGWSRGSSFGRPSDIHVDHIIPFSRGGSSTRENLVCACVQCNLYKGDRTPEEAGMEMKFLDASLTYVFGSIFESRQGG